MADIQSMKDKRCKAEAAGVPKVKDSVVTNEDIKNKLDELAKKIIETGNSHTGNITIKPSDMMTLESLMFKVDVDSNENDKRSKTALDDVLGCLDTAIDICCLLADVKETLCKDSSIDKDSDYSFQCNGVTWIAASKITAKIGKPNLNSFTSTCVSSSQITVTQIHKSLCSSKNCARCSLTTTQPVTSMS